jgi:hypothetical protein
MTFAMVAGITGGILSLIAYIPRAVKIVKDGSHSSNTWLIWTLSNSLILLSSYALGARTTLWVPLAYFIGSGFITILAFRFKADGWTTLHKWLLGIAILSAFRWWFFASPLITQGFNVFIYLASHVMIIKTKLRSENKETWVITWALYFTGAILNLMAVTTWSIEIASYPIIIFIMNGVVFSITLRNYIKNFNTVEKRNPLA